MTSGVIGGAIFQWPLGLLSDHLDRRRILAVMALGAGVAGTAIVLAAARIPEFSFLLLGALWGGMAFPLYSVAVALANDPVRQDEYVQVSSGLLLLFGSGAIAGPPLAVLLMGVWGPGGLSVFSSAVHLLLFGYLGIRALKRLPVPTKHRSDFGDAVTSAQTASAVYEPDAEAEGIRTL